MNELDGKPLESSIIAALTSDNPSMRLKAALAIGSNPEQGFVDTLIARCAIEPDFYVREILTWALIQCPADVTVPKLLSELRSEGIQARSQALHTLSKTKDARAWPAITRALLRDSDDTVAQAAWRAAVVLVPSGQENSLAEELSAQIGRGNQEVQRSLSIALVALGEEVIEPFLRRAVASKDPRVRAHASEIKRLLSDPDSGFQYAVNQVQRILAPGGDKSN